MMKLAETRVWLWMKRQWNFFIDVDDDLSNFGALFGLILTIITMAVTFVFWMVVYILDFLICSVLAVLLVIAFVVRVLLFKTKTPHRVWWGTCLGVLRECWKSCLPKAPS